MNRELTCIICPRGCSLKVSTADDGTVTVSGNGCPRGEKYGIEECTHPVRTVTSIVRVLNRENTMVSVKTEFPVQKEHIFDVMEQIRNVTVNAPVNIGDKILQNVYGTDIIATKSIL